MCVLAPVLLSGCLSNGANASGAGTESAQRPQQQSRDPQPHLIVVHADVPLYPPVGRAAALQGDVYLDVRIEGGQVAAVSVARSEGGRVLEVAAATNAQTWRFAEGADGFLRVHYRYRLASEVTDALENDRVELDLPTSVTIVAKRVKPSCLDCRN